ncbi:uncharacterized protein C7orf50 homolog [Anopheles maculipalpis]|uniref:uncharacterized protein C7orf50 homolog n=1 Tax=Anopheles maculipalpis TaxID=1496333 RepID=UPI00215905C5|nr:uncharacterized protein C7orf50 homolog [Anopheles maculipalpis]
MGKKSKNAVEHAKTVIPAEQLEPQDAPSTKKKSKKHSSAPIDAPVVTNGTDLNGTKKDKKKKNKELPASDENNYAVGETVETVGENSAQEKKFKNKKKRDHQDPAEEGAQNHATVENGNGVEMKSRKKKKNDQPTDATEEDEQLISFKKPSKKRSAESENLEEKDDVPPVKLSKADNDTITAGTTIDQITGIKLKNKKGKRAKRREKQALQVEENRQKSKKKDRDEMEKYLQCWSTDRAKWKFHKQTQIHIQTHVFDEVEINADLWPIALEYLSGAKGSSKELLVKSAKSIIKDADAKAAAADGDETWQASSKYERARELLQFMG